MSDTHSSAAAGHVEVNEAFELKIQRAVVLCAVALTADWLLWTLAELTTYVLPLFNLPGAYEIEGFHTVSSVLHFALDLAALVGIFLLTRWPGPAKEHRDLVRVLAIVGVVVPMVMWPVSSIFGLGSIAMVSVVSQVSNLVGALPLVVAAFFCANIVRDRGDLPLAAAVRRWIIGYVVYRGVMAPVWIVVMVGGLGVPFLGFTRFFSLVFLGAFLWVFSKTWRALV